jgi:ABC-type sugar transport system substrate-binding protein
MLILRGVCSYCVRFRSVTGKIFITYRRHDEPGYAQAMFLLLEKEFGRDELFMDVQGYVKPGYHFVRVLEAQVAACDVMLSVIGPNWKTWAKSLDDPADFLGIELKSALSLGKRIIPVLVNGAEMPDANQLPDSLKELSLLQAVTLSPLRFRDDMTNLVYEVRTALDEQARRRKKVFLHIAALTEEWQVELNSQLIYAMREDGYSYSVLAPSQNHTLSEDQSFQRKILAEATSYQGGVSIISGWPSERVNELLDFALKFSSPVVFVDRNPPVTEPEIPLNVSFVSVSDVTGGIKAGQAAIELNMALPIKRVLIIAGFTKHERHKHFIKTLESKLPHLSNRISTDLNGNFDRSAARQVALRWLNEALAANDPFDVVFCVADSLTLGCLDAIDEIDWGPGPKPRILGYDGAATTKLLSASGSQIKRIVVQDTKELARTSVDQLSKMREGLPTKRIVWVEPYLFPQNVNGETQSPRASDGSAKRDDDLKSIPLEDRLHVPGSLMQRLMCWLSGPIEATARGARGNAGLPTSKGSIE